MLILAQVWFCVIIYLFNKMAELFYPIRLYFNFKRDKMESNKVKQEWARVCAFTTPFSLKGYTNIDDSPNAGFLINAMKELNAFPQIQKIKRDAIALLDIRPGNKVIEVGCGLGDDIAAISNLLGDQGSVIGIDRSNLMLSEARKKVQKANVQYEYADAANLRFSDNFFDLGYADRLLISQHDPDKVLGELVRVIKPNGKICITDIDLGSIVMFPFHSKLTPMLLARVQEVDTNSYIGRELKHKFKQNGLINLQVAASTYLVESFDAIKKMVDYPRLIHDLSLLGRCSETEALELLQSIYEAESNNEFLYSIGFFTVVGTKAG